MVRTARDSETGVSWVPANARRPPARRPHPQARRFSSAIMSRSGDPRGFEASAGETRQSPPSGAPRACSRSFGRSRGRAGCCWRLRRRAGGGPPHGPPPPLRRGARVRSRDLGRHWRSRHDPEQVRLVVPRNGTGEFAVQQRNSPGEAGGLVDTDNIVDRCPTQRTASASTAPRFSGVIGRISTGCNIEDRIVPPSRHQW